ncbi:precorrin-2 dehydrogenase/sirohydrochlorin ferrochelatase/homocysteine S-methyltransferase [Acididesulfobacillus acetoxydans]|uniref:precorrin-2 dehydrogenase n=1 Tax=Acididesulfobacillus acetoxydans TaxID=1561005 RepID=A0A8S0XXH9_9FIRM|nr:bifunctional precorrin-2 dehydrogenase/sirohydrochlorin ferrochelatase [Acididesulfobacillus acetoxydans]CAA7601747.1 precorrin-2 dehydrogenase/sirohydrochlorin ferrochelatase/homocysteine S-methyltransferase [Acididesulfobacillus acetoxydans]CEJ09034.1 Precorrin-2 dehydrogenase [Acididesulfobacillus acetoxydans]
MSQYYPVFMDLKEKEVLVVGGGAVAERKIVTLLAHSARVRVVAPALIPPLLSLVREGKCLWEQKEYADGDVRDALLVFSCTDKEEVNARVAADARAMARWVNVADDPDKCGFIVPSILERGDLTIAVSTAGSSPLVARQIRAEIEQSYGEEMAEYLALLKKWRVEVKRSLPPEKRAEFWAGVTDGKVRNLIEQGQVKLAEGVVEQCFRSLLV